MCKGSRNGLSLELEMELGKEHCCCGWMSGCRDVQVAFLADGLVGLPAQVVLSTQLA